jgi:hypothetical protein
VAKFDELKLMVVRDKAQAVFLQITPNLLGLPERGEVFAGRLDFNHTAFGTLVGQWRGLAAIGYGEKAAIGKTGAAIAGVSDENDLWPEALAHGVQ